MPRAYRAVQIVLLAFVALASSAALAAQGVTLRYRWVKGEEMRYRTTLQTDMLMSGVPGMGDLNVAMTLVQVNKLVVEDLAADGTATVRNTYESIKMTMSIPMMGEVTYDSAAPAASGGNPMTDTLGKSVGALVGETFTLAVAPTGKVLKIDGLARLIEKTKAGAAGSGAALGLGNMDTLVSEDSQRSSIEQSFAQLPEKPVAVGETWKNEFKITSPLGLQTASVVYTLKSQGAVAGSTVAHVTTTGGIKASGEAGAMGPMTVTMGDGTSQGEMHFDVKLGRVRKSIGTLTQPLSMRMSAPDGTDLSLQAVQKTTTTMELIEK